MDIGNVILLEKDSSDGLEFWKSISSFVKKHTINEKGQFFDIHTSMKGDIKKIYIMGKSLIINTYYTKGQTIGDEYTYIYNGYPEGKYSVIYTEDTVPITFKEAHYKRGVLTGEYWVKSLSGKMLYKTKFKQGTGYWKDYYYEEGTLREEGQVTRHYKTGEWKYYNKSGGIDSIKTYTIKDSVDVRFPYCLFNKIDRCW
ncbi:hypothetical protein HW49_02085 [Porphyromonadaceae bacterium COT-184 OH4590]|nr:hypothetical protein HW49_02085 [Porphyromonadaceae bacterium COT-184 OH4590]